MAISIAVGNYIRERAYKLRHIILWNIITENNYNIVLENGNLILSE